MKLAGGHVTTLTPEASNNGAQCRAEAEAAHKPDYRVSGPPDCVSQREQSLLLQAGPWTGRFKLNQALVPGTEWAIHWPCRPLEKQTPWPHGSVRKLGECVVGGRQGLVAACTGQLRRKVISEIRRPEPGLRDRCQSTPP